MDQEKEIIIERKRLIYNDEVYSLKSNNATYDLCVTYTYQDLENDYYLLELTIPVLIEGENTTHHDDLVLTYLGVKKEDTNYLDFSC